MTQEELLLFKDLSARVPYGVKLLHIPSGETTTLEFIGQGVIDGDIHDLIHNFKPFLKPMSSMTEEEKRYLMSLKYQPSALKWKNLIISSQEIIDWLNRKMFDYRGLIQLGLALEAPADMYV